MAYIDVLPLARAKEYLRIDDSQNETDAEITSMIKASFRYIERKTNILVFARDKNYIVTDGLARVYDFPINSTVSVDVPEIEVKHLYSNYCFSDYNVDEMTLNVGYVEPTDVPEDIIELALVLVKVMFYEQESDKSFKEMLPMWAKELLNSNARFVL